MSSPLLNASAQEFQPGVSQKEREYSPLKMRKTTREHISRNPRRLPYLAERRYRVDHAYDYIPADFYEPWSFSSYERERHVRAKIAHAIRKDELMSRYMSKPQLDLDVVSKKKLKSQGRGFKSKQKKINNVYQNLIRKFAQTNYLKEEVDRSYETCRVHAKTWDGLNVIEKALDEILAEESIEIQEIGFHKSMKNKYQQKGILVYIKVASGNQVESVFDIYNSYGRHLKDHAIAVSKEEREKLRRREKLEDDDSKDDSTEALNCPSPEAPTHNAPSTTMIVSQSEEGSKPKMIMQNGEVALLL